MKNRSTLLLIEIAIMLFVFVLGAALCLYIFNYSNDLSADTRSRDMATLQAQNVAEVLKSAKGDFEKAANILGISYDSSRLEINYDQNWNITDKPSTFCLTAYGLCSDLEEMCHGKITITENGKDAPIITITASWQRGGENE